MSCQRNGDWSHGSSGELEAKDSGGALRRVSLSQDKNQTCPKVDLQAGVFRSFWATIRAGTANASSLSASAKRDRRDQRVLPRLRDPALQWDGRAFVYYAPQNIVSSNHAAIVSHSMPL